MRTIDRIIPFLAGLGLGVTATVLFAPEAGNSTRRQIRDAARKVRDGLKVPAEALDHAAETAGKVEEHAKQATEKVVAASRNVVHRVGDSMEEEGKRLQNV